MAPSPNSHTHKEQIDIFLQAGEWIFTTESAAASVAAASVLEASVAVAVGRALTDNIIIGSRCVVAGVSLTTGRIANLQVKRRRSEFSCGKCMAFRGLQDKLCPHQSNIGGERPQLCKKTVERISLQNEYPEECARRKWMELEQVTRTGITPQNWTYLELLEQYINFRLHELVVSLENGLYSF